MESCEIIQAGFCSAGDDGADAGNATSDLFSKTEQFLNDSQEPTGSSSVSPTSSSRSAESEVLEWKAKVKLLEEKLASSSKKSLESEAKVKLLEDRLEDWGKRLDEADEIEGSLRLQLYEGRLQWDAEKLSLTETNEKLRCEIAKLKSDLVKMQAVDNAEKLELGTLRSEKSGWMKEKKEKNEEIALLTSRIIALRKELRRITGKNSGDLSPPASLLLSMERYDEGESNVTPARDRAKEEKVFLTSRKKPVKLTRSFRNEARCEPFSIDDSL